MCHVSQLLVDEEAIEHDGGQTGDGVAEHHQELFVRLEFPLLLVRSRRSMRTPAKGEKMMEGVSTKNVMRPYAVTEELF